MLPMDSTAMLIALLVLLVTIIVVFVWRSRSRAGDTVLLIGLSDAGKTQLFSRLITGQQVVTYTSMQENEYPSLSVGPSGKRSVRLVDVPGADRLRQRMQSQWLVKDRNAIRAILFVVDSSSFGKQVKDAAELLYDVLYDTPSGCPVLVVCNKQDMPIAKSAQAIRTALEREFGLINSSRAAALATTDGSEKHRTLTDTGKGFAWSDLKRKKICVDFVECSAIGSSKKDTDGVEPIQEFLSRI